MASAGSAYVDILPEFGDLEGQLASELSSLEGTVEVTAEADVSGAESDIASIDGGSVVTEVEADTSGAVSEIESLGDASGGASVEVEGLGEGLSDLGGDAGGAGGNLDAFTGAAAGASETLGGLGVSTLGAGAAFGFLVSEAGEAEVAQAQLNQLLETTGANAFISADHINSLGTEIQGYAGFSDEAVVSGASMLLMLRNVSSETAVTAGVFDRTVVASADLARLTGTDVTTAMNALGRAVDNPTQGVNRLRRAKIQLTEAEIANIQALQESGDLLGAQEALLAAVESRTAGVAAAYGGTFQGQLEIAKERMGELAETGGTEVLPVLTDMAGAATNAANAFGGLEAAVGETDASLGSLTLQSTGLPALFSVLNDPLGGEGVVSTIGTDLGGQLAIAGDAAIAAASGVDTLGTELTELTDNLFGVTNATDAFTQAQFAVLDSFVQNGGAITGNTLAAINNRQAMQQLVATTGQRVAMLRSQNASEGQVANAQRDAITVINRLADRYGWTRAQTDRYTQAVLGIPDSAATDIIVNGLGQARTGIGELMNALNSIDGRTVSATVNILGDNPFFAEGTDHAPPGMAWVGEEGPELVAFAGGERVYTAAESRGIASRSGTTAPATASPAAPTINFYGPVFGESEMQRVIYDAWDAEHRNRS